MFKKEDLEKLGLLSEEKYIAFEQNLLKTYICYLDTCFMREKGAENFFVRNIDFIKINNIKFIISSMCVEELKQQVLNTFIMPADINLSNWEKGIEASIAYKLYEKLLQMGCIEVVKPIIDTTDTFADPFVASLLKKASIDSKLGCLLTQDNNLTLQVSQFSKTDGSVISLALGAKNRLIYKSHQHLN